MTRGERRAVERLVAAAVPEGDGLPPVERTDAVEAFGAWLRAAPGPNRAALRALLRAVGAQLGRLPADERAGWIEAGRGRLAGSAQFLARIAAHCYYGDEAVLRALGYDARGAAARGLALRRAEGRL
ncbi:MAG TPA: hypothetical protein VGW75_14620 [Solirubrobacteraceae bacterium]|jgi:hypothetical protein|nr:hypothetical protein [Solirubrobacteraceae bacterium]